MNILNNERLKSLMVLVGMLFFGAAAQASSIASTDDFYEFYNFIDRNLNGGLGVGIALVAFLIGAGTAGMQGSAMPMIVGVVIAAFFAFGPGIILNLVAGSNEINMDVLASHVAVVQQALPATPLK